MAKKKKKKPPLHYEFPTELDKSAALESLFLIIITVNINLGASILFWRKSMHIYKPCHRIPTIRIRIHYHLKLNLWRGAKNSEFSSAKVALSDLRIYSPTKMAQLIHSIAEDIECGCCYEKVPFAMMAQCADGHLFCSKCLRKYVEENTFGGLQARTALPCLDTSGCSESFPLFEVQRILPNDVVQRFEQRQAVADIELAKLDDLVYCPFCNFPCQVDNDVCVLECPNSTCSKASCIRCQEPNHLPLSCEEAEKKSETALRRKVEEMMTQAVIRVCNSCKAEVVKEYGCNKVRCWCGTTMCYQCRQTIPDDYSHFSKHCEHNAFRGPPCQICKKCQLFDTESADDVAMAAREEALKELTGKELNLHNHNIGPTLEPGNTKRHAHLPNIPFVQVGNVSIVGPRNVIRRVPLPKFAILHPWNANRPALLPNLPIAYTGNARRPARPTNVPFVLGANASVPEHAHNVATMRPWHANVPAQTSIASIERTRNANRNAHPPNASIKHPIHANRATHPPNASIEHPRIANRPALPHNVSIERPRNRNRPALPPDASIERLRNATNASIEHPRIANRPALPYNVSVERPRNTNRPALPPNASIERPRNANRPTLPYDASIERPRNASRPALPPNASIERPSNVSRFILPPNASIERPRNMNRRALPSNASVERPGNVNRHVLPPNAFIELSRNTNRTAHA